MKTICLMPVKNEKWILQTTVPVLQMFCDHIIIADQNSKDGTKEYLQSIKNVEVINNDNLGHSNIVRWQLLDYCRQTYGNNNLILCIDADELLPPIFFKKLKDEAKNLKSGTSFQSPWVQMWRSVFTYRLDNSVWNPRTNIKPFAFIDDGIMDYDRSFIINDHTSRIPLGKSMPLNLKAPLLHFQFANWNRAQAKQAWYRCNELIKGGNSRLINQKYAITQNEDNIQYAIVDKNWYQNVLINTNIENASYDWYVEEILSMFEKYGKEYFSELDIWNVVPEIRK